MKKILFAVSAAMILAACQPQIPAPVDGTPTAPQTSGIDGTAVMTGVAGAAAGYMMGRAASPQVAPQMAPGRTTIINQTVVKKVYVKPRSSFRSSSFRRR